MDFSLPDFIIENLSVIKSLGYANSNSEEYRKIINYWFQRQYSLNLDDKYITYIDSIKYGIKKMLECCLLEQKKSLNILNFTPSYNGYDEILSKYWQNVFDVPYSYLISDSNCNYLNDYIKANSISHILLSNPHNPTGNIISKNRLDNLLRICEINDVYLLVDEAFADIVQIKFSSVMYSKYKKTICFRTIGKTFNLSGIGGGYLIVNSQDMCYKIKKLIKSDGLLSPNIFAYLLTKTVYTDEGYQWLANINEAILENKNYLNNTLRQEFANKLTYEVQYGTYMAWVNYSKLNILEEELDDFLKKNGVKVIFSSKYHSSDSYFRVSLACNKQKIVNLIKILKKIDY